MEDNKRLLPLFNSLVGNVHLLPLLSLRLHLLSLHSMDHPSKFRVSSWGRLHRQRPRWLQSSPNHGILNFGYQHTPRAGQPQPAYGSVQGTHAVINTPFAPKDWVMTEKKPCKELKPFDGTSAMYE